MSETRSIAERLSAGSFPHPVSQLRRQETALSWIVLTGTYAYKIKKAVRLDFVDAATLERRRFLCEEELRLNRRFAPELYLDVQPITLRGQVPQIGGDGPAAEYTVRMRQFAADDELSRRLRHAPPPPAELAAFGTQLADWHEAAAIAVTDEPYGRLELVASQALENFPALLRAAGTHAKRLQRLQVWTRQELTELGTLLEQRRLSGRVRECHGDLHAGNIVRWQERWLPFDCLEFEPRLRWTDVFGDVAFLFMDLLAHDREALAYAFVSAYLERSGDYAGLRLLRFFSVYRALVRAKVDALDAQRHAHLPGRLLIAEQLACTSRAALLLMYGVTGSGKSWLSSRLIGALGALRVRSDLERRRRFGAGAYSAAATAGTYERLWQSAASALHEGYRIIVDTTFLERSERGRFLELAAQLRCPALIIACHAPHSTLTARIAQRNAGHQDPSEATAEVLARQLRLQQPWTAEERDRLIDVDTSVPDALGHTIETLEGRLQRG